MSELDKEQLRAAVPGIEQALVLIMARMEQLQAELPSGSSGARAVAEIWEHSGLAGFHLMVLDDNLRFPHPSQAALQEKAGLILHHTAQSAAKLCYMRIACAPEMMPNQRRLFAEADRAADDLTDAWPALGLETDRETARQETGAAPGRGPHRCAHQRRLILVRQLPARGDQPER